MNSRRLSVTDIRQIEVSPFDLGPLPDDGILVENAFTAVSVGTEIHNWCHGARPGAPTRFPHATGYCSAGTVLEVGPSVEGITPGDRVCGEGSHASHTILRSHYQKIPGDVDLKPAAFMVMGAIAIHGARVARIELGESVVVFGLGIVGQLAAQFAHLSGGVPVIGVDLNEFRIEKAIHLGCDAALNPDHVDDLREEILQHCREDGANVILESTGIPTVYPTAVSLACMGGRVVALGSPRGTVEFDFLKEIHLREVTLLGAHQPRTPEADHIYYRWTKDRDRALVMQLMATDRLQIDELITHVERPESCQSVYTMLADDPSRALGVLFEWQ